MNKFEEKIKEILRKYVYKDGDIYVFYSHRHLLKTAKEIASIAYPKEFVEWLSYKSHGNFDVRIELHKYWDGTVNEWRTVFRKFTGLIWEDITLDELFDYWQENINK